MSFLGRFRAQATPMIPGGFSLFSNLLGSNGTSVTPSNAMQVTTVFACNRVIAETISSIGLHLYKVDGDKKDRYTDHPLYDLLGSRPNPLMTSVTWREIIVGDLNFRGNHYSQIVRNQRGQITAIYPLIADNMKVGITEDGKPAYEYTHRNGEDPVPASDILHIPGIPSGDGITGISPITANARAIELGKTAETYGQSFFDNGATPTGVIEHPQYLDEPAANRLRSDLKKSYAGAKNAGTPMVLESGMKFNPITISNNDSQFLEIRKYQKEEIASIFRVPMHLINSLENATFSNIEHQSLEFIKYTILPTLRRVELAMETSLLSPAERGTMKIAFNVDTLLRGDFAARTSGYATLFNIGVLSQNDIRHLENMNPITDGDTYFVQLNMADTSAKGSE